MKGSGFDMELDELTLAGAKRGDMRACEKIYHMFHKRAFTVASGVVGGIIGKLSNGSFVSTNRWRILPHFLHFEMGSDIC